MDDLIGSPHLFGRYLETREGFVIELIGIMTLQKDGKMTDYGNPNEGSWIPYKHDTVRSDKAFAFASAHCKWIPGSTWQQSLGKMPIGYI